MMQLGQDSLKGWLETFSEGAAKQGEKTVEMTTGSLPSFRKPKGAKGG
jgi:hypothetical protein